MPAAFLPSSCEGPPAPISYTDAGEIPGVSLEMMELCISGVYQGPAALRSQLL